jgi:hypothetical protein
MTSMTEGPQAGREAKGIAVIAAGLALVAESVASLFLAVAHVDTVCDGAFLVARGAPCQQAKLVDTLGVLETGKLLSLPFLFCLAGFISVLREWNWGLTLTSAIIIMCFSWRLGGLQFYIWPSSGLMLVASIGMLSRAYSKLSPAER